MNAELTIYKILSFLLLPVAAFFGLICLSGLLLAISYPAMLINVFLIGCLVIYIISSFIFLTKGITNNKQCKPVLRDLVRINGVITFVFFLLVAASFFMIKAHPSLLNDGMKQWANGANLPPGVSVADLQIAMASLANFFLLLSIVLIVHILITFHLMNHYRYVFEGAKTDVE